MVVTKTVHCPGSGTSRGSWRIVSAGAVTAALVVGAQGVASAAVARPADHRRPVGAGHHERGKNGRDRGAGRVAGTVTALGADTGGVGSFTISTGRGGLLHLLVDVTTSTTFRERGAAAPASLASLAVGDRVEVAGSLGATDTIAASDVRIVFDGVVRVTGTVSALDGAAGFVLSRGSDQRLSVTVAVSAATTYAAHGPVPAVPAGSASTVPTTTAPPAGVVSLSNVVVGDRVLVLGTVGGPNTVDATSVRILPTRPVAVVGVVASLISTTPTGGSAPSTGTAPQGFVLSRGAHGLFELTVHVSATTTYLDRGAVPRPVPTGTVPTVTTPAPPAVAVSLSSVVVGDRVLVRGTIGGPGTLDATSVTILSSRVPGRLDG